MNRALSAGRVVFCAALLGMGVEPFLTGHLPSALVPLKDVALPAILACVVGGLLVAATLAAAAGRWVPAAPLALAAFPALGLVLVHLPRLFGEPQNPVFWSGVFQMAALTAGPLLLLPNRTPGRLLLAGALAGFGLHHFMYPRFIASLIPHWIPFPRFWAWATGCAFVAASLSTGVHPPLRRGETAGVGDLLAVDRGALLRRLRHHWVGIEATLGGPRLHRVGDSRLELALGSIGAPPGRGD